METNLISTESQLLSLFPKDHFPELMVTFVLFLDLLIKVRSNIMNIYEWNTN
jgi:hypothetical protein